MPRLWEIEHPYYCAQSNYLAPGDDQPEERFSSWKEFIEDRGNENPDMNLIFRFDWYEGAQYDLPEYDGDDKAKVGQLILYYILQRKGHYGWVVVDVCRNDEPAIVAWLLPRYQKIAELWKPFYT